MSAAVADVILLSLHPVSCRTTGLGLGTQAETPAFLCRVWGSNLGHQGVVAILLLPEPTSLSGSNSYIHVHTK